MIFIKNNSGNQGSDMPRPKRSKRSRPYVTQKLREQYEVPVERGLGYMPKGKTNSAIVMSKKRVSNILNFIVGRNVMEGPRFGNHSHNETDQQALYFFQDFVLGAVVDLVGLQGRGF